MTAPAFSLAHLTVLGLAPPEMVRVAACCGYGTVGLRLIPAVEATPAYPLMRDPAMMRATKAALADTGVGVLDIEFVRIAPGIDLDALEPALAAGAELGARHVIAAPYDPDLARLADRLGAFAERAAAHGLGAVLEFFPWTVVPDLGAALDLVAATGRPDLGILVDALHFDRSHSRLDRLGAVPASRLPFVHLCDAPVRDRYSLDELLYAGRVERLPPGEGGIDVAAILRAMPPGIPIALEVPMAGLAAAEGFEAVARRAIAAARRLLGA